MLLKAGKGSGGAGGFGDREGRGRREEDPDAGRYIDPGTATFLCFSRLSFVESNLSTATNPVFVSFNPTAVQV